MTTFPHLPRTQIRLDGRLIYDGPASRQPIEVPDVLLADDMSIEDIATFEVEGEDPVYIIGTKNVVSLVAALQEEYGPSAAIKYDRDTRTLTVHLVNDLEPPNGGPDDRQ